MQLWMMSEQNQTISLNLIVLQLFFSLHQLHILCFISDHQVSLTYRIAAVLSPDCIFVHDPHCKSYKWTVTFIHESLVLTLVESKNSGQGQNANLRYIKLITWRRRCFQISKYLSMVLKHCTCWSAICLF